MFELFCNLCTNGINLRYLFTALQMFAQFCLSSAIWFFDNSLCIVRMFQFNCWFIHVIIFNYAKIRFQKSLNWFFASLLDSVSFLYQSSVKFNYVEIKLRHIVATLALDQFQRLPVSSERNLYNRLKKCLLIKIFHQSSNAFMCIIASRFVVLKRKLKIHVSWSIFWNFLFETKNETAKK